MLAGKVYCMPVDMNKVLPEGYQRVKSVVVKPSCLTKFTSTSRLVPAVPVSSLQLLFVLLPTM